METSTLTSRPGQSNHNTSAGSSPASGAADSPISAGAPVQPARPVEGTTVTTPASTPALSPAEALALALSPSQVMAIEKMLTGHTLAASASAAGITRMTLYNWLHRDPKFQAAYNAWQLDAITGARTKLLAMSDEAVATIGRAVKTEPKIALAVLKATGALDRPTPGSTNHEEVDQLMQIERLQTENRLQEELFEAKHMHSTGGKSGSAKSGKK